MKDESSSLHRETQPAATQHLHSGPVSSGHQSTATPKWVHPFLDKATALRAEVCTAALAHHPDADLHSFLVAGLTHGLRIDFNRGKPLSSARQNIPSAEAHAALVKEYLQRKMSTRCLIGPLPATGLHVNRFGVIHKGHTSKSGD